MPRARKTENKGLPARWRNTHGAYYYQVPPGQEGAWDNKKTFRLGATLPAAYAVWAERIQTDADAKNVSQLLDRYLLEVIPRKAITTQAQNRSALKPLRIAFGKMRLTDIVPRHVYKYVDVSKAKTGAHREIEVLSHAFTKAVEWGYIDRHPFKGEVRLAEPKPRSRYIEDWEILECLSLDSKRKKGSVRAVQAYIRLAVLTGLRRGDLLRLTMSDLKDDGIHVEPGKTEDSTGVRLIIAWTDELRSAVAAAKAARPVQLAQFLFCNRDGDGYFKEENGRAGGWESMWSGFIKRVLTETKVKERFTEHDFRAKCGSDAESLEHAQKLLAHASSNTTKRFYRRKPEIVKPIK